MRCLAGIALALLVLALAGCAKGVDSEHLRICRLIVPALHPQDTALREGPIAALADGRGVTIDYIAREPGAPARPHTLACRFAGRDFDAGRTDLVGVTVDGAAFSDIKLLILKRWWLSEPVNRDRAALAPSAAPRVPAPVAYAIQQGVNAVPVAAIYALLAVAYTLVVGLTGKPHLAFGEIAIGASIGVLPAVVATATAAIGLALPALAGLAVAVVIGATIGRFSASLVDPDIVGARRSERGGIAAIIATFGLAIALQEAYRITQGPGIRWIGPLASQPIPLARAGDFIATVTPMQMIIAGIALMSSSAMVLAMRYSAFGRAWRAEADDPLMAALLGIDPGRLKRRTFALAGALAGVAGWIIVVHYGGAGVSGGPLLTLKAIVAAILGGSGSLPGALAGGLLLGLGETLWTATFDATSRDIAVLAALAAMLALRPGGLFGFADKRVRQV